METKKKSYRAIAEKLQLQQCAIIQRAHKACLNILRKSENLRVEFNTDDIDYDVVIYEDNKHCKLQSAYLITEGSENIQLSLYCYQDEQTYNTSSLNTNLDPIELLMFLAAKVTDAFKVGAKKAKLVSIEVISRVIVDETDPEEVAIQRAFEKIAKDPMGYMSHDNVLNVEDDDEMPYNPETDKAEVESYAM